MQLSIIVKSNPFFESTASANRWRTLIEGLAHFPEIKMELLITGGYANRAEQKLMGKKGLHLGMAYQYLCKQQNDTLWKRRFNNYVRTPLFKKRIQTKLLCYLLKQTEGIVWTSVDLEGFELSVALKKKESKLKTFVEMSEFLDIHLYNEGNTLQKVQGDKLQTYFEKKALYSYDGIALMTSTLVEHYIKFKGKLPELLHLPMTVDLARFENVTATEVSESLKKPYVAFIGVMNNKKDGVDILIESFAKVKKQFPKLNLYLFGPFNYDTPGHLQQIKSLQLLESVFYKGEVHRDEVPSILSNATLLALPRPDSKQAQGGFPTKLGEYLASGTPVCATRVGELPMYLQDQDSVFFAESGSIASFEEVMRKALSDPENAKRIGFNGRKVAVTHFNASIQAKKLYDFLKQ